jgi:hypothetical protein
VYDGEIRTFRHINRSTTLLCYANLSFFPNVHTLSWPEYRGDTVINGLVLQWMRAFEPRRSVQLSIMMCLLDSIIDIAFVSF